MIVQLFHMSFLYVCFLVPLGNHMRFHTNNATKFHAKGISVCDD